MSLPVHCQFIMDEFANVSLPDDFDKILSVMRSRGVSVSIILHQTVRQAGLHSRRRPPVPRPPLKAPSPSGNSVPLAGLRISDRTRGIKAAAGKTRFFCKPNVMQCNTSMVILDPKGEIVRDTGGHQAGLHSCRHPPLPRLPLKAPSPSGNSVPLAGLHTSDRTWR